MWYVFFVCYFVVLQFNATYFCGGIIIITISLHTYKCYFQLMYSNVIDIFVTLVFILMVEELMIKLLNIVLTNSRLHLPLLNHKDVNSCQNSGRGGTILKVLKYILLVLSVYILGYEPAALPCILLPIRSRVGSFFLHGCLVPRKKS